MACTRAREEIHLFTACKRRKNGSLSEPATGTLLQAAWPAAKPVLEHLTSTSAPFPTEIESTPRWLAYSPLLSLAAAVDPVAVHENTEKAERTSPQPFYRLPASFDPLERFQPGAGRRLHYPSADTLRHQANFDRPEGSFAARAFGNVVHRFLDLVAEKIAGGLTISDLQNELPAWRSRILTSFRAEGLPPALCVRETDRTLQALDRTVRDADGAWILAPHHRACSEYSLQVAGNGENGEAGRVLRADRTFLGGEKACVPGETSHLWIVDFKTADPGGRSLDSFFAAERRKYEPQMQAYARAMHLRSETPRPVILALFYPLVPHLLYWSYGLKNASDELNAGY